MQFLDIKI